MNKRKKGKRKRGKKEKRGKRRKRKKTSIVNSFHSFTDVGGVVDRHGAVPSAKSSSYVFRTLRITLRRTNEKNENHVTLRLSSAVSKGREPKFEL